MVTLTEKKYLSFRVSECERRGLSRSLITGLCKRYKGEGKKETSKVELLGGGSIYNYLYMY